MFIKSCKMIDISSKNQLENKMFDIEGGPLNVLIAAMNMIAIVFFVVFPYETIFVCLYIVIRFENGCVTQKFLLDYYMFILA